MFKIGIIEVFPLIYFLQLKGALLCRVFVGFIDTFAYLTLYEFWMDNCHGLKDGVVVYTEAVYFKPFRLIPG